MANPEGSYHPDTIMPNATVSVAERDYLDEDLEIRGQKYVCMSFLSPEAVIRKKDVFLFSRFLADVGRDVTALFDNLAQKYEADAEAQDMLRSLRDRYDYLGSDGALQTQYETFLSMNPRLQEEYDAENEFQTSVRGIKVRGCYETLGEAENRVKQIQKFDKQFNVYIGSVGCWCPWDPSPDAVGQQEYGETQLNTLMKQYKENIQERDALHEVRRKLFGEPGAEGAGSSGGAGSSTGAAVVAEEDVQAEETAAEGGAAVVAEEEPTATPDAVAEEPEAST
jgi:hypothetical protein